MKSRSSFLLSVTLFGVLFMQIMRILFLLYQHQLTEGISFLQVIQSALYGLYHDISITGYILMLSLLILMFTVKVPGKKLSKLFYYLYTFLIIFSLCILIPNLELFRNWGFHIDASVLDYLRTPQEAMASTDTSTLLILLAIFAASLLGSIYLLKHVVINKVKKIEPISWKYTPIFLFLSASMLIPIRGGIGIAPMNVGFVYHSHKVFADQLSVNPVWNFLYSLKDAGKIDRMDIIPDQKATKEFKEMISPICKNHQQLLSKKDPNIILIILESFASTVTDEPSVTPNFNKYKDQGIFFNNFYGIGDRTKNGIVGVLSGYPSLPKVSLINHTQKIQNLPSICKILNSKGYTSNYYYGGDLRFANMFSYIINMGYQHINSVKDFPSQLNTSKWGVHDQYLFEKLWKDIKNSKQPFFMTAMTLSSHEPFDVPMSTVISGDDEDSRYKNSVYYSDLCLGKFIERLKKSTQWDNTLVIMVADHGTRYINHYAPNEIDKYKIPMLWLGGVIKNPRIINTIGCQPDMANTLLHQIGEDDHKFIMGKDLLNDHQKGFAYFTYNNGFGYVDKQNRIVIDLNSNSWSEHTSPQGKLKAESVLQYIDYALHKL